MRRILFCCLVLGSLVCLAIAWTYDKKIELIVEPLRIDVGECDQGTSHDLNFRLTNRTWDEIEVVEILKSCGCMENSVSNPALKRNETADLKVVWQVGQHRGKKYLPIFVRVRDKTRNEEFNLEMHATTEVRADIEFEVDRLDFDIQRAATKQFGVRYRTNRYEVSGAGTTHPSLAAKWDAASKSVSVSFDPTKFRGASGVGYVVLETTNPQETQVKIPVLIR